LLYLDGEPASELVSMLEKRAAERESTFHELRAALSEHWLSDDLADPVGFFAAGRKSREIVVGMRSFVYWD
jgi:hypothetical protein